MLRCRTDAVAKPNNADDNENVKKTIGLISKTTTAHVHHTFLYISFRFRTTMTWKCLISRYMEDVNKQQRNFISLSELEFGPLKFSFRRVRLQLTKWVGIIAYKDWKNANSLFKRRSCRRRVVGSYSPYSRRVIILAVISKRKGQQCFLMSERLFVRLRGVLWRQQARCRSTRSLQISRC